MKDPKEDDIREIVKKYTALSSNIEENFVKEIVEYINDRLDAFMWDMVDS